MPAADVDDVVADPGEEVDDRESRLRKEWDVVCMAMSGALRNLSDSGLDAVSDSIAEGHL